MVQPAVRVVRVTLTDNAIEPREIYVPANYPIRFSVQNQGGTERQFAIPHAKYSLDNILPGQTREATWTFVDVGQFEMVSRNNCDQENGVKAVLIVENLL
ncbi:MAG TPA: cupredoxin domain-containing protein [Chloroflexota bacterium]|nr:cupredoxin domain-containing protein [Chloroflexota bacterium]